MKKILNLFAIGAVLTSVVSCDLNLFPKGTISYAPGQQIITSQTDLDGFEANILSTFRALDYGVYDASDLMTDYFNAVIDNGNNYNNVHRADNTLDSSDYDVESNWSNPYAAINIFSIFINGAQEVPAELKEQAAEVRGYAYLGRAHAYIHLARHFAKPYDAATAATDLCVPLVTAYDQTARPERATTEVIYGQIKKDLDSAAVLLAKVEGQVRAQKPTIDAVNAVYARYYLDIKDYANAAAKAMAVINTGKYSLSSTAAEMEAEWINDNGNEPIMQFYASLTEGIGGHSYYMSMSSDSKLGTYIKPMFIPTAKLVNAYEADDLRLAAWFNSTIPSYHQGNMYNKESVQYLTFKKYYGNPDLYTAMPNTGQAKKPFLISEMYLIAAEAYLHNNQPDLAKEQLNVLQTKRGATATNATEENIKEEWFKETVGEGLRMSCLKRWGDGFEGRTNQPGAKDVISTGASFEQKKMPASDYHWVWPIPSYEMQTNLNLKQNDGYAVVE